MYILWNIVFPRFLNFFFFIMDNVFFKKLKMFNAQRKTTVGFWIANGHLNHAGDLKLETITCKYPGNTDHTQKWIFLFLKTQIFLNIKKDNIKNSKVKNKIEWYFNCLNSFHIQVTLMPTWELFPPYSQFIPHVH